MIDRIRVLIADDQTLLRDSFRVLLDTTPGFAVVGEAGTGREAVQLAFAQRPDVVLMDIRMPDMNGIEATEQICANTADTRVLILTTFDLDEYVYARCGPAPAASCSRTPAPPTCSPPSGWSPPATRCSLPASPEDSSPRSAHSRAHPARSTEH